MRTNIMIDDNLKVDVCFKLTGIKSKREENRSMVNVLECLVTDYYRRNHIELPITTKRESDARTTQSD